MTRHRAVTNNTHLLSHEREARNQNTLMYRETSSPSWHTLPREDPTALLLCPNSNPIDARPEKIPREEGPGEPLGGLRQGATASRLAARLWRAVTEEETAGKMSVAMKAESLAVPALSQLREIASSSSLLLFNLILLLLLLPESM